MVARGLVPTRSQAESYIRLGKVSVDGQVIKKPGYFAHEAADLKLAVEQQYVSRAGLKLASVAEKLGVDFDGKVVLDVGSSTGGFTDYALRHGASRVYAVDVGTDQLHPSLRRDKRVEVHGKTDIRDFVPGGPLPEIAVADVSFISLREIIPHVASIVAPQALLVMMVKPQFEAGKHQTARGVVKNDTMRRAILHDFELWVRPYAVIVDKADSDVAGEKGNRERFYVLRPSTQLGR
jgi:23S rRNA (cytidine1920-2'-O)/16S rRNA (cytidine1409-2'-O)-methyltransferase